MNRFLRQPPLETSKYVIHNVAIIVCLNNTFLKCKILGEKYNFTSDISNILLRFNLIYAKIHCMIGAS